MPFFLICISHFKNISNKYNQRTVSCLFLELVFRCFPILRNNKHLKMLWKRQLIDKIIACFLYSNTT